MPDAPSFDDIAVALSIAASKLRLDLDQLEIIGFKVGVSNMGLSLAQVEMQKHLDLVVLAHRFFKENAAIEPEMRAVAARKRRGSWLQQIRGVAAL